MRKVTMFLYWMFFGIAVLGSCLLFVSIVKTKVTLLLFYAFLAIGGYYIQEKINGWISARIYGVFKTDKITVPRAIVQFRTFLFGVAITLLWASIGVDLTVSLISGFPALPEVDISLYDLTVFLMVLSVIPEIVWLYSHMVNDALKRKVK